MPSRNKARRDQLELWQPHELPVTHRRCRKCLGVHRVDKGCLWCASGGHARAEAARFANGWLVAQFPWKARTMPRASYAGRTPFPSEWTANNPSTRAPRAPARHRRHQPCESQ